MRNIVKHKFLALQYDILYRRAMTQNINGINPNVGGLSEAMAGSQAITFTATDRKIIEERGGTIDKKISFKDAILQKKDRLLPEVENEQSLINPDVNVAELQNRQQHHQEMLKRSPFNGLKDQQSKEEDTEALQQELVKLTVGFTTLEKSQRS